MPCVAMQAVRAKAGERVGTGWLLPVTPTVPPPVLAGMVTEPLADKPPIATVLLDTAGLVFQILVLTVSPPETCETTLPNMLPLVGVSLVPGDVLAFKPTVTATGSTWGALPPLGVKPWLCAGS